MKRQLISTQKIRNNRSEHIGQLCVPAACQMGEISFLLIPIFSLAVYLGPLPTPSLLKIMLHFYIIYEKRGINHNRKIRC